MPFVRETIGRLLGVLAAPVTGAGAWLRHARFFHPEGAVYRALVVPVAVHEPYTVVAWHLAGEALVRMSTAWWRGGREWLDVLGCAIRFRSDSRITAVPSENDQDLLLATVRWPWTTLLAPLTTRQHDFLGNNYHAVSPFLVEGLGRAKWRLIAPHVRVAGENRGERLDRAVANGLARFHLQVRPLRRRADWVTIADVKLRERVSIDQDALRFSPFRSGRGIRPWGLVQAMRGPTYQASQSARPEHRPLH
jgi:hypothetical protein